TPGQGLDDEGRAEARQRARRQRRGLVRAGGAERDEARGLGERGARQEEDQGRTADHAAANPNCVPPAGSAARAAAAGVLFRAGDETGPTTGRNWYAAGVAATRRRH